MDAVTKFLSKNRERSVKVHCYGDAMIDEYYDVKVNRISPEFPMPIMHSQPGNPVTRPGGAANVAYQLKHFNVDVTLIAYADEPLLNVIRQHPMSFIGPPEFKGHVPVKRRFLDDGIQVNRWDTEAKNYGLNDEELYYTQQRLVKNLPGLDDDPDVVILSDYGKGFFNDAQAWIRELNGLTTVVDPKAGPIEKWRGCSVFKPNAKEAFELSGLTDWREQCEFFAEKLNCWGVVITQSGNGFVGYEDGRFFEYRVDHRLKVESVIGAGDCYAAILGAALAQHLTLEEAAQVAFKAGSVYVQNRHNRPIIPAELVGGKIVNPDDLLHHDFKLVFTNGCFDIIHPGHVSMLEFAKSKGDKLVVAVNSDESVKRLKGESRPVNVLEDRMAVLSAMEVVDFVVAFEEDTPINAIERIKPDVLVKGADYTVDQIVGHDLVPEIHRAPIVDGKSTTSIINKVTS
jgi:D-beta-D-heptose 7-phosphate kinase/D-beta-D-heptose 1-phosphate adenosyltransferase